MAKGRRWIAGLQPASSFATRFIWWSWLDPLEEFRQPGFSRLLQRSSSVGTICCGQLTAAIRQPLRIDTRHRIRGGARGGQVGDAGRRIECDVADDQAFEVFVGIVHDVGRS
jgi:hypothetical protein